MTIGQRIAQKRKEQALSQEALGARLGVSRQSIYKWESDAALPEIDKLIALSRLFGVTMGWLLGVEEPAEAAAPESAGELTETQLHMVEEIAGRYIAAQPGPKKRRKWPFVLAGIVLFFGMVKLFDQFDMLRMQSESLQNNISQVERSVDSQINSISSRVEELLKAQNSLTADYGTELVRADLAANRITFSAYAVPKTFAEGMTAEFVLDNGTDDTIQPALPAGKTFQGEITCELTDGITLSVVFLYPDGTRQTQLLDQYDGLYTASFPDLVGNLQDYRLMNHSVENGAVTLTGCYVSMRPDSTASAVDTKLGRAEIQSCRVGLFKNQRLVAWAEPCEKPDSFQGFEGEDFYLLPDVTVSVGPEDTIGSAALVTDQYGRQAVYPGVPPYRLDQEAENDSLTWVNGYSVPDHTDLGQWTFG